jgi:hypothetical protein
MLSIQPYKANQQLVVHTEFTAHLSYGVPQVIVMHDNSLLAKTVLVNNKFYSNTTRKHQRAFKRSLCEESYTFIPATPAEIEEVTGLEVKRSV